MFVLQVGFRPTGRRCSADGCSGRLKDNILDWEDVLPEDKLELSEAMAENAVRTFATTF